MNTATGFKRLALAGCAATLLALTSASVAPAQTQDEAAAIAKMIAELRLRESAIAVRERTHWRAPKKIVVLGGAPQETFATLGSVKVTMAPDVASAARAAVDADIVMGLTSYPGICEPEILNAAKQLRWIVSLSAGVERCMAVPSVRARDVLITNMRGVDSAVIAEHAIALMLGLAHGLDVFIPNQVRGRWSREDGAATKMQLLTGKTLLIVGLGGIGTEVAQRAHGLGMKVTATRASGRAGPQFVSYVGAPQELLTLAKAADVVVNTAPLTRETTGMFDAKFFATLKPTAFFINVARGKSVVTADLVEALQQGRIAGAGLDVVEPEPLPPDHPLWRLRNVIITPHTSSRSDMPATQRWMLVRENFRRYLAGEKLLSQVDLAREY